MKLKSPIFITISKISTRHYFIIVLIIDAYSILTFTRDFSILIKILNDKDQSIFKEILILKTIEWARHVKTIELTNRCIFDKFLIM